MRILLSLLLAGLILALPAAPGVPAIGAAAAGNDDKDKDKRCKLKLRRVENFVWRGSVNGYDPFDRETHVQEGQFDVEHTGAACRFFVTFSEGQAGSFDRRLRHGQETLAYQIYDSISQNNVLKDLPSATAANVLAGQFGTESKGKETLTLIYAIAIPAQQLVSDGNYTDRVRVTIYEGTLQDNDEQDDRNLHVRARVPRLAELSLVRPGALFDPASTDIRVDFDEMEEGERLGVDLLIRSNAGYRLTLQSENRGAMAHADGAGDSRVPYTLTVNGGTVRLDRRSGQVVARRHGATTAEGDRLPVEITIGSLRGALPGTYRDNVTATIRTLN